MKKIILVLTASTFQLIDPKAETDTNKTLMLTVIAANGVAVNQYSQIYVQDTLDMNALFD